MTLLELLRQELPKRGGWPEGAVCVVQDNDGQVCFSSRFEGLTLTRDKTDWLNGEWGGNWSNKFYDVIADDRATAIVTCEQYGWDGTGLPPVGVKCEHCPGGTTQHEWEAVTVVGIYENIATGFTDYWLVKESGSSYIIGNPYRFRPLRTEAERAIDEMVQLSGVSTGAAKILYDAGYRK